MARLTIWIAALSLLPAAGWAQSTTSSNYAAFEAIGEQPVQLGYYASAKKDCSGAPLPTVQVLTPPAAGMLTVRRAELKTNKIKGCPDLTIPAQVVFYQARSGSSGTDHVVYGVTTVNGEVATYDVTITIKSAPVQKPSGGSPI
ncbi:MAG: hypothetical protein HXX15_22295 [Rhodopseudomonas sp.]|uniref:hypothetical protein n=1 Tax=Rhodopseudomonas sp. TaxID=1078 RepID=UPI00184ED7FC|nr:hypothetical protein [Rhodopseudomonas sp.]NVN88816.1 hypothetical protein [Rhodopseudomonas sp.]